MLLPHRYKPLSTNSDDIRLVTLWPGAWGTEIRCTLQHAHLADSHVEYEALSYTWGDLNDIRQIVLDGRSFSVSRNLEIALQYFRPAPNQSLRVMWVDAICINQDDLRERSAQVRRMRQIFTSAAYVFAWTGEADVESEAAFDLMAEIQEAHCLSISGHFERSGRLTLLRDGRKFDLATKNWRALDGFFNRAYWSRVWVIQEISTHKATLSNWRQAKTGNESQCLIIAGNRRTSLATFILACRLRRMMYISGPGKTTQRVRGLPWALFMEDIAFAPSTYSLSSLVHGSRKFKASDARDKVYAVLGLACKEDQAFPVDYTKSEADVYQDVVRFCVERDRNLSIISDNITVPCVDFEHRRFPSWLYPARIAPSSGLVRYLSQAGTHLPAQVEFDNGGTTMMAEGINLGRVESVVGPFCGERGEQLQCVNDPWAKTRSLTREEVLLFALAKSLSHNQQNDLSRVLCFVYTDTNKIDPPSDHCINIIRSWLGLNEQHRGSSEHEDGEASSPYRVIANVIMLIDSQCVFITESGQVGLGPYHTQKGDSAVVLFGGESCFVLRSVGSRFTLQGDAHVEGVMDGQLSKDSDEHSQSKNAQRFVIC